MTKMHRNTNRLNGFWLLALSCFLLVGTASAQVALPPTEDAAQPTGGAAKYEYVLEGRTDPFVPFITPQAATQTLDPNEIIEEEVELTGMQLFEPGQLTLVAVMYDESDAMAMVEDVTGKGYILKQGMPIGRRGVVSNIDLQQVVVTETARTRAGKELTNTIVMRLKKEGDE